MASPDAGAPALKCGDVNTVTPSPGQVKGLIISDSKLLENKRTRISCSKLVLYNLLLKEKYIISENIIPENLITKILKLSKSKIFYNFIELVSILYKYPYLFEVLKKLFPFEKLVEQKELTGEKENDEEEEIEIIKKIKDRNSIAVLWLELFYIYWKNKIIPFLCLFFCFQLLFQTGTLYL